MIGTYTIAVPFVRGMLEPETEAWAKQYTATRFFELDPHDNTAYFRLLAKLWREPGDLIVVEQDVVPPRGIVDSFVYCRYSWCTSPYPISRGTMLDNGLGCARFCARTRRRYPAVIDRVGHMADDGAPLKDWRRLDTRLSAVLHALGYRPHLHGTAKHLHDYSARP